MYDKYNNICVRVDSLKKIGDSIKNIGSGFLIKNPKNDYYIITAFHCIGNEKKMELFDNIQVWSNQAKDKIEFIFRKEKIKFFPNSIDGTENIDLAIIPIDREIMINGKNENIEDINDYGANILIIDRSLKQKSNLKLVGFPEHRRYSRIDLQIEDLDIKNYRMNDEVGEFTKTNFNNVGGQTLDDKLDGFSGSGIFYESDSFLILEGIFVRYKDEKDLGGAISSTKLIELFNLHGIELPYNEDGYFLKKMNDTLNNMLQQLKAKDPTSEIEKIENEIKTNFKKIIFMINSLTKEDGFIKPDEYIEVVLEHLCLLQHFENEFEIKEDRISIEINGSFLSKVFKSKYKDDYPLIKVEFNKFINEKKFKIENLDHIYIEGVNNLDSSPFQCDDCPYHNNIPEGIRDKVEKGILSEDILVDFMNSDNSSELLEGRKVKDIRIKCAECISIGKLDRLEDRKEKLWK